MNRNSSPAQTRERVRRARHDAYRDLILDAAVRAFGAHGYAAAKVADIAAAAGVATGTVYGIFPSKQDLYRAVHRENLAELARRYAEIPSDGPVRSVILARSEAATRFLCEHPDYLRMYLREAGRWGFDAADLPRGAAAFVDHALYARGVADGELLDEDPRLLQSLVMAASQVHLTHWLHEQMRESPDALAARIRAHTQRAIFRDATD